MSRDNPKEVRENLFSEVSHHSTRGDYSTRGEYFKGGGIIQKSQRIKGVVTQSKMARTEKETGTNQTLGRDKGGGD